jgi:outer membrane protein assembly factor BamB
MVPYDKKGVAAFSSPTIAGQVVLIGSSDGNLYALEKGTGSVLWRHAFGVPVLSTPCVSGNTVFAAAYDGNLYAFTPRQ